MTLPLSRPAGDVKCGRQSAVKSGKAVEGLGKIYRGWCVDPSAPEWHVLAISWKDYPASALRIVGCLVGLRWSFCAQVTPPRRNQLIITLIIWDPVSIRKTNIGNMYCLPDSWNIHRDIDFKNEGERSVYHSYTQWRTVNMECKVSGRWQF